MAEAAESPALKKAFEAHLNETEGQLERLSRIFDNLGVNSGTVTCKAMQGLVKEGEEIIESIPRGEVRDAALIAAAQRVEHYEIAAYGTVRTYAHNLGMAEHKKLLQQTLDEEGATDKKLNDLAKQINKVAVGTR